MSYGKTQSTFWDDEKIETVTDEAALLALFLISGRHRNAIGCFKLGIGAITDIDRFGAWGQEAVIDALNELREINFIIRDDRTGWTFIRNIMRHDPFSGVNAAIHAAALAQLVPANSIVYAPLKERLEPVIEKIAQEALTKTTKNPLDGKPGWPMRTPSEPPSEPIQMVVEPPPEVVTNPPPIPLPLPSPHPHPSPQPPSGGFVPQGAPPSAEIVAFATIEAEDAKPLPVVVIDPEDDPLDLPVFLDRSLEAELVRLWNEMADRTGLAKVLRLNDARRRLAKRRIVDSGGNLELLKLGLAKIEASPFLRGENDRGWRANFDFLLTESKFTKLIEGVYDRAHVGNSRMDEAWANVFGGDDEPDGSRLSIAAR